MAESEAQKKLEKLFKIAFEKEASDLHLVPGYPPALRIERKLVFLEKEENLKEKEVEEIAFFLIPGDLKEKFLKEKDIDFSFEFKQKMRFRTNIFFQSGKISISFRVIPQRIKNLEELNLPKILKKFTTPSQGFVLVCGPASHGKSTTLAALLEEINQTRQVHIITIEDPIEFVFESKKALIEQREIGRDAKSFERALKATFRQDPDVIMIGEMRDLETIKTALSAAETGHLVFATLHTNSAAQTIHRIVDSFPAEQQNQIRNQLASSLYGIISLRLVPRIGGGLIPACEIMFNTPAIANLIRENKIHEIPNIIEISSKEGMISLEKYLANLVKEKKITFEEGLKYALDPKNFQERFK